MKANNGRLLGAATVLVGGAAATGAAVLAGLPGRQAAVLLPGAVSWGFFLRWCRRSFRAQADLPHSPLHH
jgi:hypothetical protein